MPSSFVMYSLPSASRGDEDTVPSMVRSGPHRASPVAPTMHVTSPASSTM